MTDFSQSVTQIFDIQIVAVVTAKLDVRDAGTKFPHVETDLADVIAISGNGTHLLALTADGLVYGWGSDDCGECDVPALLSGVTAIAAGYGHSLAVMPDE